MDFLAVSCHVYSMKSIVFTVLALLGALLPPPAAVGQQSVTDFEHGNCSTTTFNISDSFAQNLDVVAKSLIQNSSHFMYSLASSETVSQSNSYAYGMYQCRGDISLSDCHDCVRNGFSRFLSVSAPGYNACNNFSKGARAQYKGCYLRYENYKFYNRSGDLDADDLYEVQPNCSGSSNESSALYQQNLGTALEKSATAAPKHELYGYNATSVGSGSNTAYALTQCLGYLNSLQCATCLSQVSNYSSACNKSVSGEVYFNTCYYLFSDTFFLFTYNNSPPSVNSPDAPSSDPPTIAISGSMPAEGHKNHTPAIVGIVVGHCLLLAIIAALALCFLKRRKKAGRSAAETYRAAQDVSLHADEQRLTHECGARRFSLKELRDATNDFHPDNKLGEGGFGPVYQGTLISGMEVAIKLLSAQSHQGKAEFLNEVKLITGVQHRNLIELIGYCIEDSKPILVYEYLPNRSLNLHLFDVDERNCLDWPTRFNIIVGIARGLRYLHEDSQVRIIHRDIKASNILLDNNWNPKIADFGLARLFADDRSHLTTRVVGTFGYLAPEYVINGQLTEKADVYSFGLVALEIVSGRKVVEPRFEEDKHNILDWTWALYEKHQQLQIVDERMQKSRERSDTNVSMHVNIEEVIRVVHVALLCTQLRPQVRPRMSKVHNMLRGKLEILEQPTKPITVSMWNPIKDLIHDDGSSSILFDSFMPSTSRTSQPSVQLIDPISEVEPR